MTPRIRREAEQIGHLSHLDAIMAHVSPRSGLKRTFGFAYHHDGHAVDPAQTHKLIPPDLPFVQEVHLLREDSDLYLPNIAIQQGAAYRDRAVVDAIDVDDHGVTVRLDDGTTYRGRYLLDGAASGRSPRPAPGCATTRPVVTFVAFAGGSKLADGLAAIACDLTDMHDGGDHWIIVGRVAALHGSVAPRPPLIFFHGDYRRLQGLSP